MGLRIISTSILLITLSGFLIGCEIDILLEENFEDDVAGELPNRESVPDNAFYTFSGSGLEDIGLEVINDGLLDSTSLLLNNNRPPLEEVIPWNRPFIIFVSADFDWDEEGRIFMVWNGSIDSGQSDSYLDIYTRYFRIRLEDGKIYYRNLSGTFSELGPYTVNSPHTFLITLDRITEEYSIEIFQRQSASIIRSGPKPIRATRSNPFTERRIDIGMNYSVKDGFDPNFSTGSYEIDNVLITKEKPEI